MVATREQAWGGGVWRVWFNAEKKSPKKLTPPRYHFVTHGVLCLLSLFFAWCVSHTHRNIFYFILQTTLVLPYGSPRHLEPSTQGPAFYTTNAHHK